jgi:hypothetical protein
MRSYCSEQVWWDTTLLTLLLLDERLLPAAVP